MFFVHVMERTLIMHPSFLGPNIQKILFDQLRRDVEGTNTGDYYILCVMDNPNNEDESSNVSEGRVVPGSAYAEFTISFRAIVWKPFKGEVLDGVVGRCLPNGFFVQIGPLRAFVSTTMISSEYKFDANAPSPCFYSEVDITIEPGSHVRIKLVGVRSELNQMYAVATMKEDYLGCLD